MEEYLAGKKASKILGVHQKTFGEISSQQQKKDLDRQINMLKNLYPDYELITDIDSGVNLNRRIKKDNRYGNNGETKRCSSSS
jgi:predicted site-specific integrase-resolvase